MRSTFEKCVSVAISLIAGCSLWAGQSDQQDTDEAAIRAAVKSYVAAYNQGDAKGVAEHWSETGEWISPSGEAVKGPKAIEEAMHTLFSEHKGVKLEVLDPKVRLISADVAMEEGRARVLRPGESPDESTYLAIHIKKNGRWKLDSIRETELPDTAAGNENLRQIDWLVGDWVDESAESTVEESVSWTKNKAFLSCSFRLSAPGIDDLEGTLIIGWDPAAKVIRSWMFDADGSFGEGVWTRKGERWFVKFAQILADGRKASATNIYKYVDENTYTWQSIGREVDGVFEPNINEVKVVRKGAFQQGAAGKR
jgi:uncharacterized protein (TIGR02246 family)